MRRWLPYLPVSLWLVISLAPFLWVISLSFKPAVEWATATPSLLPQSPTWDNFRRAWLTSPLPRFLLNSTVVTLVTLVATLALGSLAGYAFGRLRFPGRDSLFFFILTARMIPALLNIIPLYVFMFRLHLLNSYPAMVLAYTAANLPVVAWVSRGFFESLPKEVEEAAAIDGATPWQTFSRILLPLAAPGVAASGVFVFVRTWNEYIIALTLTTTTSMRTLPVGIRTALGEHLTDMGRMGAYTVVAIVPIVIMLFLFQRRFVSGLTGGAIK